MDGLPGRRLEAYELIEEIGAGAFGAVYRAHQTDLGREVALKIIGPQFATEAQFVRRFEREAQMVARLEHPFIVPLYDYWRDAQGAYLVMRWLRGGNLGDQIHKHPLGLKQAAAILDQVAAALAVAHRARVVHRDIKPGNVLLDEDENAYLADFGIARNVIMPTDPLSSPELIPGSMDYLSPEQARGEPLTPQTDIYALGVLLYEMVTGVHPFHERSFIERLFGHINEPLPDISNLTHGVGQALNEVIQKATAKNPAQRYQDVMALARAFRQAVTEQQRAGALLAEQLTPREMDILRLLGQGLSNREIADRLVISIATVKWYNQQIYGKLDVGNRVQAALRARRLNLIGDEVAGETGEMPSAFSYLPDARNPYKGLSPFQAADHDDFFGREELVARLLRRMREVNEPRFLALVGPSGSGKTSLVRAGLFPAISYGRLPGSENWFTVEMRPGTHPLEALEIALTRVAIRQTADLHEQLRRDARGLVRATEFILPPDDTFLLLVIDQFEELFTLVESDEVRWQFLNLLHDAATAPRCRAYIVITLRADAYDRPLRYRQFGDLLRHRIETILPLDAPELTRAIVAPAERQGITFEDGLVAQIVSEISYQAAALPLLQVAMRELFGRRKGRMLTHQAYQEMGGAAGALARRAEDAFQMLDPRSQALARQLFLRLVGVRQEMSEGGAPSVDARRVPREELLNIAGDVDLMDELIDLFVGHRLLAVDHEPQSRRPTVELGHEALLRQWTRLNDWLDESHGEIRLHRQLSRMAGQWVRAGEDDSFLLHGSRLDQFAGWAANTSLRLTGSEQRYLDAGLQMRRVREEQAESRRRRELQQAQQLADAERRRAQEQALAARRLRRRALFLAGALALVVLLALAAGFFAGEANRQRLNAQEQLALTQSRELALAALNNLESDPELSILLTLAALSKTHTIEAEQMLHRAVLADRLAMRLENDANTAVNVLYSPDGSQIATLGAREGAPDAVTLWSAETGEARIILEASHAIAGHDFSPDGATLATAAVAAENTTVPPLQLWDAASGRQLAALELAGAGPHPPCGEAVGFPVNPGFYSVAFSPDGDRLVTYHCLEGRGSVAIWDVDNGRQVQALSGFHTAWSWNPSVIFSPDGNLVAANGTTSEGQPAATVWDAATGRVLHLLQHSTASAVTDVAFAPGSARLATGGLDGQVRVWDLASGEQLLAIDSGSPEVWGVSFDHAGTRLASAAPDGRTRLWDAETGRALLTLSGAGERFYAVAFHPHGQRLATVDLSGATLIWNLGPTGEFLAAAGEADFERVALLEDGERVIASDTAGRLSIWDLRSGRQLIVWQAHEGGAVNMAFDAGGSTLATAGEDGLVKAWDTQSGEQLWQAQEEKQSLWGIDISPDGSRVAVAGFAGTGISVRDLRSGDLLQTVTLDHPISTLAYDESGRYLAASVLGAVPTVIVMMDAASSEELFLMRDEAFGDGVNTMTFAPDGERLAAASFGGQVTIFDAAVGEPVVSFGAHQEPIWDMAFTPDGERLATASVDGTVRLWDPEAGELLLTLEGFGGAVAGITFNAGGDRLFTASYDRTLRGFLLDLDELQALARSRLTRWWTPDECRQYLHRDTCPENLQGSPRP